jgi:hypothetical protein
MLIPHKSGGQSAQPAIMDVKDNINATSIASRYGLTVIDSIPELNRYLVQGTPAGLLAADKDSGVASIDYDLAAELSERALLYDSESTAALLDPESIALLLDKTQDWDGQHWSRASLRNQPALQKIGFEASTLLWDPVTVAVIDTGIDPNHETLIGSTLPGKNFVNPNKSTNEIEDLEPAALGLLLTRNSSSPKNAVLSFTNTSTLALLDPAVLASMYTAPTPYFGHGTMVSGLIHTLAPSSRILPLKVFDANGFGNSFRIAQAIVYATNQGASVINMSFGLATRSRLVDDAVDYAWRRGVVLVASVGNTNSRVDKIYPAGDHQVIGVAATDLQDQKAIFSCYGPAADVSAPGQGLVSPYPAGLYAVWSGTSASAALVSGEAALLLSQPDLKKDLKAKDVVKLIGERVDHLHGKWDIGRGRINLTSALRR